ncbi:hypothetical protein CO2235_170091 [Cupriavidus oxalaticus]|uniref:Uncharacterized protein n=1 Tax=Cupriavidus oxalaticus TaxID=96344 RepID=A0A375G4E2_9BURK|nr:hypothetical protein CO2235_170091 [Cupriavidus oxalaticus]
MLVFRFAAGPGSNAGCFRLFFASSTA